MSRCFRFPPPGYEKKTTSDDADLITKEKRKEKRRKKDKKNKDRREGKEKKDEERSKEKSREKKDRKEKKKDKKEKNKDREKNRTLDEKRIEGKRASDNGVAIDDPKIVQELGQRLGDESKVAGIRTFQKVTLTDNGKIGSSAEGKRKSKDKNEVGKVNGQGNKVKARSPENAAIHNPGWMDRRRIEQSSISSTLSEEKWKTIDKSDATSHNWGWVDQRRVVQSNIGVWAEEKGKSNDKNDTGMANGRGNKVEARAPENRTVFNSPWSDQRRTEQNWGEEKGKTKDRDDARKANGRGPETAAVHTSVWMDQRRIEGMQVKEEDVEVKENGEHNGRDKKKNKDKDKDREKKSKSKDKRRDKKEKKEKMKGRREKDTKEESKFKGSSQSSIDTQNFKPETLLKENRECIPTSGNLGKRKKEVEANGRFHENRMQPNKLPRSIPSSGLKSESEKPGFPFDQKADIKINGSAETRFSNSASTSSSSASVQTIEKCEEEASARLLPHPDTKFLSQILSIPKLEECPDLDDQEWLFSHKNLPSKKMETASSGSDGTMQVWAEALPLKSADLSALPYVIPF